MTDSKSKPQTQSVQHKVYFTIFVIVWVVLCTVAGQLVVAYPMKALLGASVAQPGWTLLFYLLSYMVSVALIIFIPPRIIRIYGKQNQNSNKLLSKSSSDDDTAHAKEQSTDKPTSQTVLLDTEKDLASTPTSLGIQHLPTFVDLGLAPVSYVVYLYLAAIASEFMSHFSWFNVDQAQDVGFSNYITGLDRIFAIIAIVLIAPIAEELIMRGWLYDKLRQKWKIPVAMLLVSLTFAILHGQWNVGVSVFILSFILCGLREITGTIWAGILLHILVNGIAFYFTYIAV